MSKGNTTENDFIKTVFLNTGNDPSWRANSNLYISLHTDDPGEAGNQLTNEATYTNYDRVEVVKTAVGWTISGNQASNAAQIQFPQCGVTGCTVTHVAIGTVNKITGAGQILYSGQLNDSLAVSNLIQPQFNIGALVITED